MILSAKGNVSGRKSWEKKMKYWALNESFALGSCCNNSIFLLYRLCSTPILSTKGALQLGRGLAAKRHGDQTFSLQLFTVAICSKEKVTVCFFIIVFSALKEWGATAATTRAWNEPNEWWHGARVAESVFDCRFLLSWNRRWKTHTLKQ